MNRYKITISSIDEDGEESTTIRSGEDFAAVLEYAIFGHAMQINGGIDEKLADVLVDGTFSEWNESSIDSAQSELIAAAGKLLGKIKEWRDSNG